MHNSFPRHSNHCRPGPAEKSPAISGFGSRFRGAARGLDPRLRRPGRRRRVGEPGRTVTEADVVAFAGLSGDFNPIHVDHEAARRRPVRPAGRPRPARPGDRLRAWPASRPGSTPWPSSRSWNGSSSSRSPSATPSGSSPGSTRSSPGRGAGGASSPGTVGSSTSTAQASRKGLTQTLVRGRPRPAAPTDADAAATETGPPGDRPAPDSARTRPRGPPCRAIAPRSSSPPDRYVCLQLPRDFPEGRATVTVTGPTTADDRPADARRRATTPTARTSSGGTSSTDEASRPPVAEPGRRPSGAAGGRSAAKARTWATIAGSVGSRSMLLAPKKPAIPRVVPEDLGDVGRLGDRAAVAEDQHVVADRLRGVGHRLDPARRPRPGSGADFAPIIPLVVRPTCGTRMSAPASAIARASSSLWT